MESWFWQVLVSGIAIGLILGMLARWVGTKLWGQKWGEMVVICASCGKEIQRSPVLGETLVCDGICPECKEKHFPAVRDGKERG